MTTNEQSTRESVTRSGGSWIADGFRIGQTIMFEAPWYRRAWWWFLRVTRIRRHTWTHGIYVVTSVESTTLEIKP